MSSTLVAEYPASSSRPEASPGSLVTPPPFLQNDPDGAQAARQRFAPKKGLAHLLPKNKLKVSSLASFKSGNSADTTESTTEPSHEQSSQIAQTLDTPISLDNAALIGGDIHDDRYQWAILYENQRGITIFSIPYYSSLSLLPTDPAPFTFPDSTLTSSQQPPVTLKTYPLPDGTWRWVSRCWMIDMRSDGEVQHDGFEYNWFFRKFNWHAKVGSLSAGGLVRRRRWVRLMVQPAKSREGDSRSPSNIGTPNSSVFPMTGHSGRRQSLSSFPPSILTGITDLSGAYSYHIDPDEVWTGTSVDGDWDRCRRLMKRFGRDGRKLELWRLWLGYHLPEHRDKFFNSFVRENDDDGDIKGKKREKQWTEDEGPMPSEVTAVEILLSKETVAVAQREHIIPVLRTHGVDILHFFVFPESRAQFLKLLGQAGLFPDLNMNIDSGISEIDFWSYAKGLRDFPGSEDILKSPLLKQVFQPHNNGDDKGVTVSTSKYPMSAISLLA